MTIARKIFIGRVSIPAITASSLYDLMKNSALHWGYETTALTEPSLDSITGSEAHITPDAAIRVGIDSSVATTGITVAAGATFSLDDFGPAFGVVDPNQIWFYSQSGSQASVAFTAR